MALMEPYALIDGAGPVASSADLFTTLVEELQSAEAAGLTACELEDLLAVRGREVQRQLLQDHLDLRGGGGPPASSTRPRRARTGSPGPGWRQVITGCWPRCSARCRSPGARGAGRVPPVSARAP